MDDTKRKILIGLAALAGLLVLLAIGLYAADYGAGATIIDKGQDANGRYVVAETSLGGLEVKRYLPTEQWLAVQEGFHVVYHIRSGHTEVYTSEGGRLIWQGGG